MKDLPHHMKKLNRQIIRSMHREQQAEEVFDLELLEPQVKEKSAYQKRKQAKQLMKKAKKSQIPTPLTPESRNRKMKHRVPVFDQNKSTRKITKSSRKKTPRI